MQPVCQFELGFLPRLTLANPTAKPILGWFFSPQSGLGLASQKGVLHNAMERAKDNETQLS